MMDEGQLKFLLQQLNFTAPLPSEVLEPLAAASTLRQFEVDATVFREGGGSDLLYLVYRGRLALEMSVPGRGRVRILTLGPGEMVGWSALLGGGRMTASAIAVEPTEVVATPIEQLEQLCLANSAFGYHLMRQVAMALSKRLVATRLQLLDLFAEEPHHLPANEEPQ